jgi:AcrR family transcriptional regulator
VPPAGEDRSAAPRRDQARTRLARAAVVDAARSLFFERGYGTTTVEAISERADVPTATVYRLFSSKHGILKALLDVSIVGDHERVPMAERPEVRSLVRHPDPREQLAGFVSVAVRVNERVAPLYRILVSAAGTDPDAAVLLDDLTRQRQEGQRTIARALARARALRPELRERDAADLIHALMSPELYRLLVVDRGWKPDRYERWLTDTLGDQLLPSDEAVP